MISLAVGAPLTQATFTEFVDRLRHDCVGEGVSDHCTSDAFFVVQHKVRVYGLDKEYSDKRFIRDGANVCEYETPLDYWNESDDEEREALDLIASWQGGCTFLELSEDDQWGVFEDGEVEDHSVIYYEEEWKTINFHFTRAAAEAFIKRKGHDYGEMRVYVDAHTHGWEYNAIKQALLDGRLQLVPDVAGKDPAPDVAKLAEALEWLRGAINCTPENDKHQSGAWISTKHPRIRQIDELLVAYRKQGGDL